MSEMNAPVSPDVVGALSASQRAKSAAGAPGDGLSPVPARPSPRKTRTTYARPAPAASRPVVGELIGGSWVGGSAQGTRAAGRRHRAGGRTSPGALHRPAEGDLARRG